MNKLLILFIIPLFAWSQNNFYLGFGSITTVANLTQAEISTQEENIDFGLYYGNNIKLSQNFMTVLEVFYLNQKVVLNKTRLSKFELHQNIGFGIKPGFYSGKHSVHFSTGILGVYVFDQNNEGNQFDHFDESYYVGLDYNYDLTNNISCNFGILLSDFNSISHFSNSELQDFAVLQFTLHYNIKKLDID
ncbi:MAG: hypothetical protein CMP56_03915 [Flavobacteriales bacterium]|jgi:hypothetical protein|nr:hypothetical protein [Flavobacteriales bacterium]|tara:strand:+ start:287 stop:856 length:570 start_codon:yes stop_codon:yes gene_type:complete